MSSILAKFGIGAKMALAFLAMLAMLAGLGGFAVQKIGEVNTLSSQMRSRWLPATKLVGDIHAYTSQYRIAQGVQVTAEDEAGRRKASIQLKNATTAIGGLLADYGPYAQGEEQQLVFKALKTSWSDYLALNGRMAELSTAGDSAGAAALFRGDSLDKFYEIEDNILALTELNDKGGQAASQAADTIYKKTRTLVLQSIVASLLVAIFLMIMLLLGIARPLSRMSAAVRSLSAATCRSRSPRCAGAMRSAGSRAPLTASRRCSPPSRSARSPTSSAPPRIMNAPRPRSAPSTRSARGWLRSRMATLRCACPATPKARSASSIATLTRRSTVFPRQSHRSSRASA